MAAGDPAGYAQHGDGLDGLRDVRLCCTLVSLSSVPCNCNPPYPLRLKSRTQVSRTVLMSVNVDPWSRHPTHP